jgi:hypothetical protein
VEVLGLSKKKGGPIKKRLASRSLTNGEKPNDLVETLTKIE